MKTKKLMLVLSLILTTSCYAKSSYTEKDILGVWKLTKFVSVDENGREKEWCRGSHGTIAYLPGAMSVSINCEEVETGSGAERIGGHLFYSGPFELDTKTNEVIHRVRNFSHKSLHQVYRRTVEMDNKNYLRLVGLLGAGKKAIVEWTRVESFSYDSKAITGVWELVGSENEVDGVTTKTPFCTGFHGTILYTPGGYNAVSINCGEKKDETIDEPADYFGRKFFYAGKYKVDGNEVIQTPDNASDLSLIGKPALRVMSFDKDILILEGENGSKFRARWRKRNSFVGIK